jgi:hypothetical protein
MVSHTHRIMNYQAMNTVIFGFQLMLDALLTTLHPILGFSLVGNEWNRW